MHLARGKIDATFEGTAYAREEGCNRLISVVFRLARKNGNSHVEEKKDSQWNHEATYTVILIALRKNLFLSLFVLLVYVVRNTFIFDTYTCLKTAMLHGLILTRWHDTWPFLLV